MKQSGQSKKIAKPLEAQESSKTLVHIIYKLHFPLKFSVLSKKTHYQTNPLPKRNKINLLSKDFKSHFIFMEMLLHVKGK